jgi:peroxiredoxin
MKKILLLLPIVFIFIVSAEAQIEITRPIEQLGFNENTIVTNTQGKKYTHQDWSKLVATGKYKLNPVKHDSDSTAFILTERDEVAENQLMAKAPKPEKTKFFKNGNSFAFFNMKEVNGTMIRSADLKGKIVVLNFWFIACPPCRYEMPELSRIAEAYQNRKDVVFIGISLDKTDNVERFLKVSPFKYHIVADSMPLFTYYGVDQCPASLVVDKGGIIRFNSQGYGEGAVPYWIRKTIDEIK